MRVLISGSCVSNDIFSLVAHDHKIAGYLPRMSMATAFGAVAPEHLITAAKKDLVSLTHRYWALNDLEKRMEKVLTSTTYDILLLDFVDERFSLAVAEDGSLFTCGDQFRRSEADRLKYEIVGPTSPRRYELWLKGVENFASLVDPQKVFVNKVYWATEANDGSQFDEQRITNNNRLLEKLYRHVEMHYGFNFITYDQDVFLGDVSHKWEKSPVHYTRRYYDEAMKALNVIEAEKTAAISC